MYHHWEWGVKPSYTNHDTVWANAALLSSLKKYAFLLPPPFFSTLSSSSWPEPLFFYPRSLVRRSPRQPNEFANLCMLFNLPTFVLQATLHALWCLCLSWVSRSQPSNFLRSEGKLFLLFMEEGVHRPSKEHWLTWMSPSRKPVEGRTPHLY